MKTRRFLALLLMLAMLIGLVPMTALAYDEGGCPHTSVTYIDCDEIAPTCFEPGSSGYWCCDECGMFLDKSKENGYWEEMLASRIPATGHAYNADTGYCDNCNMPNPVYSRITSLDDVNEDDMYIIVASVAGRYFVLGGLDESTGNNELGVIDCVEGGNAVEVVPYEDGSISLINQNYVGNARPSEFMFDIDPDQLNSDLDDNFGLTPLLLKLDNYCVYPFQSQYLENTGYMGVPRYANDVYGMWDATEWIIDFYTTEVDENTYRDDMDGFTHAEQVARGNIGDNISEGDLLLYRGSYYCVGGAMFTLRFRERVNLDGETEYYFICGEDWCLEGSGEWDPITDTVPTNDIQYAVSLYRYDVPEVETHTCEFDEWKEDVGSNTHSRSCECGKTETLPCTPGSWVTAGSDNHTRSCSDCGREYSAPHSFSTTYTKVDGSYHKSICTTAGCNESKLERHTFGQWVANNTGTEERRDCTAIGCDAYETRVIHQHSYGEWTDDGNGSHTRICTAGDGCTDTQILPHDWSEFTKLDGEYHIRSCDTCGAEDKVAHSFGEGVVTEQPDNHNDGTMTYTCDACDHTKEESIPKLPDQFENVDTGITLDIPANSQAFLPMGTVIGVVEKPVEEVPEQILGEIAVTAEGAAKPLGMYDLSLILDGAEIQPDGSVVITIPAPDLAAEYDSVIVVYIAPDGSYEECATTVNEDGSISFETDHFSLYAVIGIEKDTGEAPEGPETPENPENPELPDKTEEPDNTVWIIISVVGVILVGGAVAFVFYIKAKRPPSPAPEADTKADEEETKTDEE